MNIIISSVAVIIMMLDSSVAIGSTCKANGKFADHSCTPGVIDSNVTQTNIHETICVPGYSASVRPPSSYTGRLKKKQMVLYGLVGKPSDYEEDHLISLALGGSSRDPKNLWPELWKYAHEKDKAENRLHKLVCSGKMKLSEAQHIISSDWTRFSY